MTDLKYVAFDLYQATFSAAVLNLEGKLLTQAVMQTHDTAIRDFLRGLSVLARENDALNQRASIRLKTGILSVMMFDGDVTKLALCDVTGDERLEIMVLTSEIGEHGLTLRCFNFDGQSLNEIADVNGQIFRIRSGERDRPAVITNITVDGREMKAYETRYRWNGERFEEIEKVPAGGIIVQPPKRAP
jgi:hypothetical protein